MPVAVLVCTLALPLHSVERDLPVTWHCCQEKPTREQTGRRCLVCVPWFACVTGNKDCFGEMVPHTASDVIIVMLHFPLAENVLNR